MTEQEINHHFQAVREFIANSQQVVAKKFRSQAIATAIGRLDKLHDKMLDMASQQQLNCRVMENKRLTP
jgi:hypothetical protein